MTQSASNIAAEKAILASILSGTDFDFDELTPEEFSHPLHRRLYARMRLMNACDEPISLLGVIDSMRLDEADTAATAALCDPMYGPFTAEHLRSHVRIVKREVRHRELQRLCDAFLNANGDIPLRALELQAAAQRYVESAAPGQESGPEKLFDAFDEFETQGELSFAITGFLQNEAITGVAGLPGDGKTFIALSLCKAMLFGPGKWLGIFDVPKRAEKIIYLIPESSRGPIKHRLKLMGLYDEIRSGRLLMRTLSKGDTLELDDPRLLRAAENSNLIITDTAVRFMKGVNDTDAAQIAATLSADLLNLLRYCPAILAMFHSPKAFRKEADMTLEALIRGSGELGAVLATAWGIKQVDKPTNTIHIENLKPRDFDPCGPFEIIGRPYIDETGDFVLHKRPDECGRLADEQPDLRKGGGAPQAQRDSKAANLALARNWLHAEPGLNNNAIVHKFKIEGIRVDRSTVSKYRKELGL